MYFTYLVAVYIFAAYRNF